MKQVRFGVSLALTLFTLANLTTEITFAQRKPYDRRNLDKPPPGSIRQNQMAQKVNLPNFPDYPGRLLFITGSYSNGEFGRGFTEIFNSRDPVDRVIEWYKQSLRSAGWKTNSENRTGIYCGYSDGSTCEVNVRKKYDKEGGTQIRISYFQKN